jgi:hypothetical protein
LHALYRRFLKDQDMLLKSVPKLLTRTASMRSSVHCWLNYYNYHNSAAERPRILRTPFGMESLQSQQHQQLHKIHWKSEIFVSRGGLLEFLTNRLLPHSTRSNCNIRSEGISVLHTANRSHTLQLHYNWICTLSQPCCCNCKP